MPDFRVFCTPSTPEPRTIVLNRDESHHLITVNRARRGSTVIAFDGRGIEWECELTGDHRSAAELSVRALKRSEPLPCAISLAQALPKGPAMDAIVRKATEIGVTTIVPLESERTEVHLDGSRSDRKTAKWHTAALEAAKQCGNPFIPEIKPVQKAADFMRTAEGFDLKLMASLDPQARPLKSVLAGRNHTGDGQRLKVVCLVGPEGDFSVAETNLAKSAGFEPVTLGRLVLRCETAAIYILSVLAYELGP